MIEDQLPNPARLVRFGFAADLGADPEALRSYGLIATIPRRGGSTVHGLVFASNLVLHSGLDDEHGHFIAAYGNETDASESAALGPKMSNALRTRSRSSY